MPARDDLRAKAERAYEAARAVKPVFAGMAMPTWSRLYPELQEVWVQKVAEVEADPKRWLSSDDPVTVAVAVAIMGPMAKGGTAMPERDFRREYMAEFLDDPEWEAAVRIAAKYELECEEHDRRVCTGRHPEYGAMPINGAERALSERFAGERWIEAKRAGDELGVSAETMRKAREWVGRRSGTPSGEELLRRIVGRPSC